MSIYALKYMGMKSSIDVIKETINAILNVNYLKIVLIYVAKKLTMKIIFITVAIYTLVMKNVKQQIVQEIVNMI